MEHHRTIFLEILGIFDPKNVVDPHDVCCFNEKFDTWIKGKFSNRNYIFKSLNYSISPSEKVNYHVKFEHEECKVDCRMYYSRKKYHKNMPYDDLTFIVFEYFNGTKIYHFLYLLSYFDTEGNDRLADYKKLPYASNNTGRSFTSVPTIQRKLRYSENRFTPYYRLTGVFHSSPSEMHQPCVTPQNDFEIFNSTQIEELLKDIDRLLFYFLLSGRITLPNHLKL